jgi:NADH-quinone oxidoreductase subunit L
VGLCSYLLIGFCYEKKSASDAGKKAFIVNRIGDFGFAIGLFLIFLTFGSLQFNEVFEKAQTTAVSTGAITAITLLLFMGAVGKSAQFPLYVWLPDAMEGPTPVSSLIHAATMVTAGVYMVARSNALYSLSEISSNIVAIVGAFTAIFAASIALVNNDLKRILAYSTVSQLGYMFVGVGVGTYAAGIFHLMTHACFKGLMFLAAGSVMHALSGELDIRKMGGLRDKMKTTHLTFFIGALAIAGFPLLSGFWSKDEILYEAFARGHYIIWAIGLLTAFMTAFYMFRLIFMTFWGSSRVDSHVAAHLHESPKVMTIPLIVLAFLSVVAGWIGIGGHSSPFASFLEPVFEHVESGAAASASAETTAPSAIIFMVVSAIVGIAGIFLAYSRYVKKPVTVEHLARPQSSFHKLLYNKYYVDELYQATVVNPVRNLSERVFWKFVDVRIVDGIVNGVAWIFNRVSLVLRLIQAGYVQGYALAIIVGIVVILGYYLLR